MILKLFFILIILYIVINSMMEEPEIEPPKPNIKIVPSAPEVLPANMDEQDKIKIKTKKHIIKAVPDDTMEHLYEQRPKSKPRVQEFDSPNPWSKVVYDMNEMYPYNFYIKLRIPSLKDYEDWKQVIPNIDFNPMTKDVIIPSKDEASALAVANLMVICFSGMMTLENILEKDLIQISIAKAKSHEMVQNKLREQIMENL